MICNLLDLKCIFVNELIGNGILAMLLLGIAYFIIAAKSKFGFDTTLILAVPFITLTSLVIYGFTGVFVFLTIISVILISISFNRIIGNR